MRSNKPNTDEERCLLNEVIKVVMDASNNLDGWGKNVFLTGIAGSGNTELI
jgi:hypothetical protein